MITVVDGTCGKVAPRNESRLFSAVVQGLMGEVARFFAAQGSGVFVVQRLRAS